MTDPLPPPPPQQAPPPEWAPPPATSAPVWRSLGGLTTALTVLFWVIVGASALLVGALANRIGVANDLESGDLGELSRVEDADSFVQGMAGLYLLLGLAIAVLFIIWFYRAAKNNQALGREHPRLGPGWAIGGWFIPFANLVIPILIAQDLWRGSDPTVPRGEPWRGVNGSPLVGWWWAALVVSGLVSRGGRAADSDDATLEDIRRSDSVLLAGTLVTIAAAVLAIQVVRKLAARQDECLRVQQNAAQAERSPTAT